MRYEVEQLRLHAYVQAFFPSDFEVTLKRSLHYPDDRVLIVRNHTTGATAFYKGSALSILDICSMESIAASIRSELCP